MYHQAVTVCPTLNNYIFDNPPSNVQLLLDKVDKCNRLLQPVTVTGCVKGANLISLVNCNRLH